MDIKPPQRGSVGRRENQAADSFHQERQVTAPSFLEEDMELRLPEVATKPKRHLRLPSLRWLIVSIIAVVIMGIVSGSFLWYRSALRPVGTNTAKSVFTIAAGESSGTIAKRLEEQHLVRSASAFQLYLRLTNESGKLMTGSYRLSQSQSVPEVVALFVDGEKESSVTILPGMTLKQLADPSVKKSFAAQGFSQAEIKQAFAASYSSPLFVSRPSGASLEGYIFPETFLVKVGDSLQSVLQRSFDELYSKLQSDGLLQKFAAEGLSIHQALTLGSIIQKETSDASAQPQVAQVFLLRLQQGISLGSDVTFIYAANQLGVAPTPTLDSPYNTRIHAGLPPGPVATMNYSALQAVANPAAGDYLFFVAGDNGVIHFSHTNDEHEQQIQQYCQKLCSAQ